MPMFLAAPAPLHPVRTFLSPDNALGFGLADTILLIAVLLLAALVLAWAASKPFLDTFLARPRACALALAALPVLLRLALLPRSPVPTPSGADDFSYLLLADTLRHFRFANPPHAFPEFFEQMFVLQRPTFSSMYALGQGLVLACGWLVFGHPWAGVLLSVAALCASAYWMLRGWTTPLWSIAGALLAVYQFGPLSYWTNSYWGGAVSATAGCLVFGALPRLSDSRQPRDALLLGLALGLGLALQLLTRPFEFVLLVLSVLCFFAMFLRRPPALASLRRSAAIAVACLCTATVLMALQNKSVTGSATTLPYTLSQYQYGIPSTFTFQPNPVPHRQLNDEQTLAYQAQSVIHGDGHETLAAYFDRLLFRTRFLRFFFLPPLYLAVLAFLVSLRTGCLAWVAVTLALFLLGSNLYPYFFPHYIAAATSLFLLVAIVGLQKLNALRMRGRALPLPLGSLLFLLCTVLFLFWVGVHAFAGPRALAELTPLETWNFVNYGDPQGRLAVAHELASHAGNQLVFVHYAPGHWFEEWIHNAADFDAAEIVWVHDRGPLENEKLLHYYPTRKPWLLEPDQTPPRLTPYVQPTAGFQDVR